MKAVISGSNIVIVRNNQNVCTVAANQALTLAAELKTAVARLATNQIAQQQDALNAANALLEAANAS
jgi:lipid-binding SYLF domain-containing protein